MLSIQKNQGRKSNEPSTAGGRELRLKARPPARFSSLRSAGTVNQKQEPSGNTLLAQRYLLSGNSYFWRKGRGSAVMCCHRSAQVFGEASGGNCKSSPASPRTASHWMMRPMAKPKTSFDIRGSEKPAFRSFVESILDCGTSPGQSTMVSPWEIFVRPLNPSWRISSLAMNRTEVAASGATLKTSNLDASSSARRLGKEKSPLVKPPTLQKQAGKPKLSGVRPNLRSAFTFQRKVSKFWLDDGNCLNAA